MAATLTASLDLKHTDLIPASGPLYMLFPWPDTLPQALCRIPSLLCLRPQLAYHLPREASADHHSLTQLFCGPPTGFASPWWSSVTEMALLFCLFTILLPVSASAPGKQELCHIFCCFPSIWKRVRCLVGGC